MGRQPGSRGRGRALHLAAAAAARAVRYCIEFERLGGLELFRLPEFLGCHVNSPSLGIGARIWVSTCKCGKAWQIGSIFFHASVERTRGVRKRYFTSE